jgi:hypothetical protein
VPIFLSREETAGDWLNHEDLKELLADSRGMGIFSGDARHHGRFSCAVVGHGLEGRTLVVPILNVQERDLL